MTTGHVGLAGLLVGRELSGRYRVERALGSGGMGFVYEATHLQLGHRVALKVLQPHLAQQTGGRLRFHREAKVAARLGHPAIGRVFDYGEDPACGPYLVMELLRGQPLSNLRGARSPRVGQLLKIAHELLGALEQAHAAGVVHRDLKPSNIFLAREGERVAAKLLDFGVAALEEERAALGLTRTGAQLGTPRYQAPEQAAGLLALDGRADLYALGATLYAMLAGEPPCPDAQGAAPLRERCPSLAPPVLALVERATALRPDDRFRDAAAMRAAVGEILEKYPDSSLDDLDLSDEAAPPEAPSTAAPSSVSPPPTQVPTATPAPPTSPAPAATTPPSSRRALTAALTAAGALGALLLALALRAGARDHAPATATPAPSSAPAPASEAPTATSEPAASAALTASAAPGPATASAPAGAMPAASGPTGVAVASGLTPVPSEPAVGAWLVSEATLRARLAAAGWRPEGPTELETTAEGKRMRVRVRQGANRGVVEQRIYAQATHTRRAEQEAAMQRKAAQAQPGGLLTASVTPETARSAELLRAARGQ